MTRPKARPMLALVALATLAPRPLSAAGQPLRGPGPVNDLCINALPVTLGTPVMGNTAGAHSDQTPCAGLGTLTSGIWYRFTGNGGILYASTCGGATWDTILRVMTGSCGSLTCVAYNDDACDLRSRTPNFTSVSGQTYYVYISGFGAADAGPFTLTVAEACDLTPPADAVPENEHTCDASDTVNGGCFRPVPVFSTITCGVPVFGSGHSEVTFDQDWYLLDLPQADAVTITVRSEFPAIFGLAGDTAGPVMYTGDPATWCPLITHINPITTVADDCNQYSRTVNLTAGTWAIIVGTARANVPCNGPRSDYLLTVTTATGCGGTDCNANGIPDHQEIAANPALDCYNPAVIANPHVTGGPDGALDACQCQGNFNRDPAGVNSTDISALLTGWLAAVQAPNTNADINCSGSTNSTDVSMFLTIWFAQISNLAPWDGCP